MTPSASRCELCYNNSSFEVSIEVRWWVCGSRGRKPRTKIDLQQPREDNTGSCFFFFFLLPMQPLKTLVTRIWGWSSLGFFQSFLKALRRHHKLLTWGWVHHTGENALSEVQALGHSSSGMESFWHKGEDKWPLYSFCNFIFCPLIWGKKPS